MTEQEWENCTDPTPMLEFLRGKASDRKLRLLAVACCRRVGDFQCEEVRRAVAVAEHFADGVVGETELKAAHGSADNVFLGADFAVNATIDQKMPAQEVARARRECLAAMLAHTATSPHLEAALKYGGLRLEAQGPSDLTAHSLLLRDVFGGVFHRVVVDPSWLTSDVTTLAENIYTDRAFDRMPILADALQDAGCENEDILTHCRGDGPHVRGCWVVDLILGKS